MHNTAPLSVPHCFHTALNTAPLLVPHCFHAALCSTQLHFQCHTVFTLPSRQLHFQCHTVFTLPCAQHSSTFSATVFTLPCAQHSSTFSATLFSHCPVLNTAPLSVPCCFHAALCTTQLHFQCHAVFTLPCAQHSSTFSATLFSRCPVLKKGALEKGGNGVPTTDASVSWQNQPKNHQRFSQTYTRRCTHMFQPPLFFPFFLVNNFPSRSKGAGVYSCVWSWHCTYKNEHTHGLTVTVTLSHNPHFSVQP